MHAIALGSVRAQLSPPSDCLWEAAALGERHSILQGLGRMQRTITSLMSFHPPAHRPGWAQSWAATQSTSQMFR